MGGARLSHQFHRAASVTFAAASIVFGDKGFQVECWLKVALPSGERSWLQKVRGIRFEGGGRIVELGWVAFVSSPPRFVNFDVIGSQ